ncbi:uncharacterized protein BDZ99DRAFT_304322 [Mytilinidion resinicola]|uniref:Uncharacterized protein n=1 Tax=Mytilinidion resinicola TaxID=574789 RepID=A0A6A6YNG2_9PEZI|nr:uncharacterized protein BDZ99DRAFT_304322 [Mytilinidion resinicola]KAF2810099.1 hypothetical protein BDZ99DRAFT_304322 [Mytilinidion resinicola]
MREKGANEKRIEAMRYLAKEEVVHRLIWVLAEHLDSPDKAREAITSIVDASNHRHGNNDDDNGFGSLAKELRKLRNQRVGDQAEDTAEEASNKHSNQPRSTAQSSTEARTDQRSAGATIRLPSRSHSTEQTSVRPKTSIIIPENQYKRPPSTSNPGASSSAQAENLQGRKRASWDVDNPTDLSTEEIPRIFKKDRHLYAYHALPVVNEDMQSNTPYENLTAEIRRRWKELSEKERKSWVVSYKRLLSGDLDMLVLSKDSSSPPARSTDEPRIRSTTGPNEHDGTKEVRVKREPNMDGAPSTSLPPLGASRSPALATSHLDAARRPEAVGSRLDAPRGPMSERHQISETPVVDLIWGISELRREEAEIIAKTIQSRLSQRIGKEISYVKLPSGNPYKLIRDNVGPRVMKLLNAGGTFHPERCRKALEHDLQFWVAAKLTAFPELVKLPVMFSVIRLDTTPVTDLLFLNGPALTATSAEAVGDFVCNAFRNRMHPMNYELEFGPGSKVKDIIFRILRENAGKFVSNRLERKVRPIVSSTETDSLSSRSVT